MVLQPEKPEVIVADYAQFLLDNHHIDESIACCEDSLKINPTYTRVDHL